MIKPKVLIVEDLDTDYKLISAIAKKAGFTEVFIAENIDEAYKLLKEHKGFDAMVIDLKLQSDPEAGWKFLENVGTIRTSRVLIYSAHIPPQILIPAKAIGRSSISILTKPSDDDRLLHELKSTAAMVKHEKQIEIVRESVSDKELEKELPLFAVTDLPVLITGPTGSGKESISREIAKKSFREDSLIRTVNCAAFTDTIIMSELFGHVKGSFTGADSHRLGLILEASGYKHDDTMGGTTGGSPKSYHKWLNLDKDAIGVAPNGEECYSPRTTRGGTLILDEVTELSKQAQAALLRVLDGLPIKPVGHDGIGFLPNLSVIALTNNEDKLIDNRVFRNDLVERLYGFRVRVNPLAERVETAKGIILKTIKEMVFRHKNGEEIKPAITIDPEALNIVLSDLNQLTGGIRGLIYWIKRSCTFAQMEGSKKIKNEHIERARQTRYVLTKNIHSSPTSGENHEQDFLKEVESLRTRIQTIFKQQSVELPQGWNYIDLRHEIKKIINNNDDNSKILLRDEFTKYSMGTEREKRMLLKALRYNDKEISKKLATIRGWFRDKK